MAEEIGFSIGVKTKDSQTEVDKLAASLDRLVKKVERLDAATKDSTKADRKKADSTSDLDKQLAKVFDSLDKNGAALRKLRNSQDVLNRGLAEGKVSSDKYAAAMTKLITAESDLLFKSEKVTKAMSEENKAAKQLASSRSALAKAKEKEAKQDKQRSDLANVNSANNQFKAIEDGFAQAKKELEAYEKAQAEVVRKEGVRARMLRGMAQRRIEDEERIQAQLRRTDELAEKITFAENRAVAKKVKSSFSSADKAEKTELAAQANAAKQLKNAYQRLEKTYSPLSSKAKQLRADLEMLNKTMRSRDPEAYKEAAKNIEKQLRMLGNAANGGGSGGGINGVSNAFSGMFMRMSPIPSLLHLITIGFSVFTAGRLVRSIYDTVLAIDSLRASLSVLSSSQEQSEARFANLIKEADRLGISIESMANEYKQFAAAAQAADIDDELITGMFSSILEASRALKLSADDTSGTVRALQQMLSKGKISAEELRRQLGDRLPGAAAQFAEAIGVTTQELDQLLDQGALISKDLVPIFSGQLLRAYGATDESLDSLAATSQRARNAFTLLAMAAGDNGFEDAAKDLFLFVDSLARSETATDWAKNFGAASKELVGSLTSLPGLIDRISVRTDTLSGKLVNMAVSSFPSLDALVNRAQRLLDIMLSIALVVPTNIFAAVFDVEEVQEADSAVNALNHAIGTGLRRSLSFLPAQFDELSETGRRLADQIEETGTASADQINLTVINAERFLQSVENNISKIEKAQENLKSQSGDYSAELAKADKELESLRQQYLIISGLTSILTDEQKDLARQSFATAQFDSLVKQYTKLDEALLTSDEKLNNLRESFVKAGLATEDQLDVLDELIARYQNNYNRSLSDAIKLNNMIADSIWAGVDAEEARLRAQIALGEIDSVTGNARLARLRETQRSEGQVEVATDLAELQKQNEVMRNAISLFGTYGEQALDVAKANSAVGNSLTTIETDKIAKTARESAELAKAWKELTDPDKNPATELEAYQKSLADQENLILGQVTALSMYTDARLREAFATALAKTAHIEDADERRVAINSLVEHQRRINDLVDAQEHLTSVMDRPTGLSGFAKELETISAISNDPFSGLLSSVAKVADEFANWSDQIDKARNSIKTLKAQKIGEDTEQYQAATAELARVEGKRTEMALSGFSMIAEASSKMFKEQSKEQKALVVASQAANAILVGLKMQEAAAAAIAGIATQASGDPITAIPRMATMAGIMAGLGVFAGSISGGGSSGSSKSLSEIRQERQGTGTVFGDPTSKSESIANALDMMSEVELDQYNELKKVNANLTALSRSIVSITAGVTRAFFGEVGNDGFRDRVGNMTTSPALEPLAGLFQQDIFSEAFDQLDDLVGDLFGNAIEGIFAVTTGFFAKPLDNLIGGVGDFLFGGDVKVRDTGIEFGAQNLGQIINEGLAANLFADVKIDKGFLGGSKYKTLREDIDATLKNDLTEAFVGIANTIRTSADILGLSLSNELSAYVLDLGKVSLEGLTGEEIQEELGKILSQQSDAITRFLVPSIEQFAQAGEGLLETLVRVTKETAITEQLLGELGVNINLLGMNSGLDTLNGDLAQLSQEVIEAAGGFDEFLKKTQRFAEVFLTPVEQVENQLNRVKNRLGDDLTALLDEGFAVDADTISSIENFREFFDSVKGTIDARQLSLIQNAGVSLADYFDALESGGDVLDGLDKGLSKAFDKIREFLDSLKLSDLSPLTNLEKLREAERQFNQVLSLARGGDEEALNNITGIAGDFLTEARDFYASSQDYTQIFDRVTNALETLIGINPTESAASDLSQFLDEERSTGLEAFFAEVMDRQLVADSESSQLMLDSMARTNEYMAKSAQETEQVKEAVEQLRAETEALSNAQLSSLEEANSQNQQLISVMTDLIEILQGRNGGAVVRSTSQDVSRI